MKPTRPFIRHTWLPAACAALALLAGCGKGPGKPATQVAVKVNDDEISVHQVEVLLSRQPPAPPGQAEAQTRKLVDNLVEQELAAQAARKQGLDRDPRVVQAMEATKREVLARAYQDSLADQASRPTSGEIDRYYDSQPALFAQRRLYTVQELQAEAAPEQLAELQSKLMTSDGPAQAADLLRASGVRFTARQLTLGAEDVPLNSLQTLAEARTGQSLVLPRQGGMRVVTVLQSRLAPVSRSAARRPIENYLVMERKRQLVQQGMKALREAAHVEYRARASQAASGVVSTAR